MSESGAERALRPAPHPLMPGPGRSRLQGTRSVWIEIRTDPDSRHPVSCTALREPVTGLNARPRAGARCGKFPLVAWMARAVSVLLLRHTPISAAQLGQILAAGLAARDTKHALQVG